MERMKIVSIEGVPFLLRESVKVPFPRLDDFPDCCGAGEGLGEKAIPETMWGLRVSPACWFHDEDFAEVEPTAEALKGANFRLFVNASSLIIYRSKSVILRHWRLYWAAKYFSAVQTAGAATFWKLKRNQGYGGKLSGTSN